MFAPEFFPVKKTDKKIRLIDTNVGLGLRYISMVCLQFSYH